MMTHDYKVAPGILYFYLSSEDIFSPKYQLLIQFTEEVVERGATVNIGLWPLFENIVFIFLV